MPESKEKTLLTIAGFDPCGGAGILADIRVFEFQGFRGVGVCTALTYQNHGNFHGLRWTSQDEIEAQLNPLISKYPLSGMKVGLIESLETLEEILNYLERKSWKGPIVWDPILKAGAGYPFHPDWNWAKVKGLANRITVVTPNREEWESLLPANSESFKGEETVLVKSLEEKKEEIFDGLYQNGTWIKFQQKRLSGNGRHGTGCVYSSTLLARLAKGDNLEMACGEAGEATGRYLEFGNIHGASERDTAHAH